MTASRRCLGGLRESVRRTGVLPRAPWYRRGKAMMQPAREETMTAPTATPHIVQGRPLQPAPLLDRRSVLRMGASAALLAATTIPAPGSAAAGQIAGHDIVALDASALSDAIRTRQVSCVEVMNAYLDQIARLNAKVNAIVALQDRDA